MRFLFLGGSCIISMIVMLWLCMMFVGRCWDIF